MSNAFLEADVGAQMAADVVLLGDDAAEPQPSQQELVQIVRKAMEALATTESRRGLDVVGAAFRRARDVAHREARLDRHQCRDLGLRARFSYAEPANSASFAAWLAAIKKADAAGVADGRDYADRDDASRERRATGWSLRQAVKTRLAQLATVFCELRDRAAYDAKDDDRSPGGVSFSFRLETPGPAAAVPTPAIRLAAAAASRAPGDPARGPRRRHLDPGDPPAAAAASGSCGVAATPWRRSGPRPRRRHDASADDPRPTWGRRRRRDPSTDDPRGARGAAATWPRTIHVAPAVAPRPGRGRST